MIYKKMLLGTVLTICAFTFNLKAVDSLRQDLSDEANNLTAVQIAADAAINAAKIMAESTIAEAKIKADAEIKISENKIEESEKYGLEAAKQWKPILGAALCILAAIKFYSILE